MNFVDRIEEQKLLHRAIDSQKACFIVMYGRRRLGKSTLVRRVLSAQDVYYEAEINEPAVQMALLSNAINFVYPYFGNAVYDSWESLLMNYNAICAGNSTLVLDEFPYLVQKNPSLPSTLQRLIDSGKLKFNLIICGSSQRMMQKIVLDSSEPLYGRADVKINLSPVGIRYWRDETGWDSVRTIEEFSVWGGVPRYWTLREDYDSFASAIDALVLNEHGLLFDEPASLFMDDISDIAPYSSIMTALGGGNCRFSKIADSLGRKTTDLSLPLGNLIGMRYVRKDVPFGVDEAKTKKTLYLIDDPYMAFYYRFIAPNRSVLALGRTEGVRNTIIRNMPEYVSATWERLCQIAVSGNNLLGTDWGLARRWWGRVPVRGDGGKTPSGFEDLEFDVVAESADKKSILVGECKWNQSDYAGRLSEKLRAKVAKAPFAEGKKVVLALFLKIGRASCRERV